jgi:hypothetical protein
MLRSHDQQRQQTVTIEKGRECVKTFNRQGSKMLTLEEGLVAFEQVLPSADAGVRDLLLGIREAVIRTKMELDQIHIASLPLPSGLQAICFDCGDKNLDVVYTSKRDRCQLCAPCFNIRQKRGAARADSRAARSSAVSSSQPE